MEYRWREELIDLMAEKNDECRYEMANGSDMSDYDKTNFRYRDPDARKERIEQLNDFLDECSEVERTREEAWSEFL